MRPLIRSCVDHPKTVAGALALITAVVALLVALPALAPERFPFLNRITVDTDPENMLAADEPVRVFHRDMKKRMGLWDMIVVGIVNDEDPAGVYNPASLAKIYELTEFAKTLHGERLNAGPGEGIIAMDMIAPSTVDIMSPGAPGEIRFS